MSARIEQASRDAIESVFVKVDALRL